MVDTQLNIGVDSTGINQGIVDLDRLAQAAIEAGSSVDRLAAPMRATAAANEAMNLAMRSASEAAAAEVAAMNAVVAAQTRVAGSSRQATQATRDQAEAMHGLRFAVGNVAAQFQDIAVTSAMGMNPWTIALQQGTQLSAVLGQTGGGLTGVVRTLGSAFASIISPLSLVTIGMVAAGSAALQWGIQTFSASEDAKDNIDAVKDKLDELLEGYDAAGDAAEDALSRGLPRGIVVSDLGASLAEQEDRVRDARDAITDLGEAWDELGEIQRRVLEQSEGFEGQDALFGSPEQQSATAQYKALLDDLVASIDSGTEAQLEAMIATRELYNTTDDPAIRNAANEVYNYALQAWRAGDAIYALRAALAQLQNADAIAWAEGASQDASDAIDRMISKTQSLRSERQKLADDRDEALGSGDAIQRLAAEEAYQEAMDALDRRDAEREAKRASRRESPGEKWADDIIDYQNRLDMMALENELWDAGTFERERRLQYEELLQKAMEAGVEDTPALREEIGALADEYARLNEIAEGVEITISNRTVWEELGEELEDLEAKVRSGAISWETYQRAAGAATASAIQTTLGALADLSSGLESAFEDNKAISVATAVLKGAEAVASSYAAGANIGGPPVGIAFAAVAAITAAANVAAVLAVDKNSTSMTNSGGGTGDPTPTANPGTGLHVQLIGNPNTQVSLGSVEGILREMQNYLGEQGQQLAITYKGD